MPPPVASGETQIPKITLFQPAATTSAPELALLLQPSSGETLATPLLVELPKTGDLRLPRSALVPAARIQFQRYSQVVDRFILYDTGQLPGQPGQIALMQFNQLGLDALPALLAGLGRTANLEASCPFIVLARKVTELLARTDDYQVLQYAADMLAAMNGGRYEGQLRGLRIYCEGRLKQADPKTQVPQLVKALASRDASTRRAAAGMLGKLGADARPAIPTLTKALQDSDADTRGLAATALAAIGADSVPVLIKALKVQQTRRLAASALAAIKPVPPQAIPQMIALLKVADVRDYAGAVLARWGEPTGDALLAALDDPEARVAAAPVVGQIRPALEKAIPTLVNALTDKDADYRVAAHHALVNMGTPAVPALVRVLQTPGSTARYSALLALGRIGPDAANAIGALTASLHDPDRNVRFLAVAALVKVDPTRKSVTAHLGEAVPILVEVLGHEQASIRAWSASVLGEVGPGAKNVVPALAARVEHDTDPTVRVQAALALGHLGSVDGVPTLIDAQADRDSSVQKAAAAALEELAPVAVPKLVVALAYSREELRAPSAAVLERIGRPAALELAQATGDPNPAERRAALTVLGKIGPPAAAVVPAVITALDDRDAEARGAAVVALTAMEPGSARVTAALMTRATDPEAPVVEAAVKSLRAAKLEPMTAAALAPFLADASAKRRSLAAELLQKLGPDAKSTVPALLKAREDSDTGVRAAVLHALGVIAPDAADALAAQVAALRDPEREVRVAAAGAVVRGGAVAVPLLVEALKDPNADVRRRAAGALRNIGVPARPALAALTERLDDSNPAVRARAIQALSAIEPTAAVFLTHCVTTSAKDMEQEVRAAAHVALLAAPKEALPLLAAALVDKDVAVRRAALDTIKTIAVEGHADKEVKATVWDLLAALKDDDREVRNGASWALGEIDPELKSAMPELVTALHQPAKKGASPITGATDFRLVPMPQLAAAAELETGERKQDVLAELRQRRGTPVIIALARAAIDPDKETRTRGRTSLLMYLSEKPNDKDEDAAALRLRLYKRLAEDGKVEAAQKSYRQLISELPKTRAAEEARTLLAGK